MGLIRGNPSVSRYRLLEAPDALTDEYVRDRLQRNAFVDIEATSEESSLGWVEIMDQLAVNFDPGAFQFGGFLAFTARLDSRRISPRTLSRYYRLRELEFEAQAGRKPNSQKKKEIKDSLRQELLRRSLLNTDLLEVLWFPKEHEIWLGGAGEKKRLLFEELWERTFGLAVRLLVPITLGLEMVPAELGPKLLKARAIGLLGGDEDEDE
ncbi:MAG: recombination-associated protein RdgC [Deltaproteobacteria bacterium]|jgi:DNA recombination-dependent growth factor C|nr:recombination-associated protein RdgC [Deltaproteobacteria bacterium]